MTEYTKPSRSIDGIVRTGDSANSKAQKKRRFAVIDKGFSRTALMVVGVLIVVASATVTLLQRQKETDLNNVDTVMELVAKHYRLPTDEKPALATVTDNKKVQSSFRGKVQNGDKILIYQTNQQAIVYRPTIDRIVDVEPVSIDTPPQAQ